MLSTDGQWRTELRGMSQVLSQRLIESYTPECRADLGDARCKVPITDPDWTRPGEVTGVLDQLSFEASIDVIGRPDDWFVAGVLRWTSGANAGRAVEVRGSDLGSGVVVVSFPAAHPVIRIWADGKLIHDARGTNPDVSIPGLVFRFHKGDEAQLPDPLIEAAEGHGRTPAFRGLAYLVFEDLPLENFGNRIPNITAEITFNAQDAFPALKSTDLPGGEITTVTPDLGNTDYQRQRQLMRDQDGRRVWVLMEIMGGQNRVAVGPEQLRTLYGGV